eukprot:5849191-Prymnesium_polylepis.2
MTVVLQPKRRSKVRKLLLPHERAVRRGKLCDEAMAHLLRCVLSNGALVARAEHVAGLVDVHTNDLRIAVGLRVVHEPSGLAGVSARLDHEAVVDACVDRRVLL